MKYFVILIALAAAMLSFSVMSDNPVKTEAVITNKTVTQAAIIVKDIDKARTEWAKVLGVDIPGVSIAENNRARPTQYRGNPSAAEAKLAFFNMGNLQIELIQPLGGKSTWQELIDTKGEGLHHIAFAVKDINGMEKKFEVLGMPTVQSGGWNGGAYSYIDASAQLGCILELLENYEN